MDNYTPNNVADWFLSRINTEVGDTISHLKLQKLVYYSQAWYLTVFKKPLFNERIEAWAHGPVIPSIYERFKNVCKDCVINVNSIELSKANFSKEDEQLLSEIRAIYGEHSSGYLEELTHSELPWINARNGLPDYSASNNEITHEAMIDFYSKLNGK